MKNSKIHEFEINGFAFRIVQVDESPASLATHRKAPTLLIEQKRADAFDMEPWGVVASIASKYDGSNLFVLDFFTDAKVMAILAWELVNLKTQHDALVVLAKKNGIV